MIVKRRGRDCEVTGHKVCELEPQEEVIRGELRQGATVRALLYEGGSSGWVELEVHEAVIDRRGKKLIVVQRQGQYLRIPERLVEDSSKLVFRPQQVSQFEGDIAAERELSSLKESIRSIKMF